MPLASLCDWSSLRGRRLTRAALVRPALLALALLAAACTADDPETGLSEIAGEATTVVVANSPGTLTTNGDQRVLVALVGAGPNEFIGAEDTPAVVRFSAVEGEGTGQASGQFLSNPGVALGLYVTTFDFPEAGLWEVDIEGLDDGIAAALVQVGDESPIPSPGDSAPPSMTLTGSTAADLGAISTDPNPNPDFYDLSVADAVSNGRPTVIVFATPAFCRTAICGPTVEMAKEIAPAHEDVDFVHVEPFIIPAAQAGTLTPIDAMFDWGLATEPWVFVVDDGGVITASFEGIIGKAELEAAIDAL